MNIAKNIRFLKELLLFRKPVIAGLQCLTLVMAHKPVVIVSWQLRDGHSIRLHPLRRRFRGATGAAIVPVPAGRTSLTVVAANCWRRTRITVLLMPLAPDVVTEVLLRTYLSGVHLAEITCPGPSVRIAAVPPRLHTGTSLVPSFKSTLLHIPYPQLLPFTTPNTVYET